MSKDRNAKCDACDFDNSTVRASSRVAMARCDGCERTLCLDCLTEMAKEAEMWPPAAGEECTAEDLLTRDSESGDDLCPACFEDEEA